MASTASGTWCSGSPPPSWSGAAADITKQLFAGDWDFWTDWKDRQWWPIITPFAIIIIGSALQYIQWLAWRFPTGMTYTAVCMFLCTLVGRWLQWGAFVYYPMNFVWPATMVAAAIFADWVLLKTKSFILTSIIGSVLFAIAWWVSNYIPLAPYLQPAEWMDRVVTVADVQGIEYVRSQTPEYLRIIEHGSLRTFLGGDAVRGASSSARRSRSPATGSVSSSPAGWPSGRSAAS